MTEYDRLTFMNLLRTKFSDNEIEAISYDIYTAVKRDNIRSDILDDLADMGIDAETVPEKDIQDMIDAFIKSCDHTHENEQRRQLVEDFVEEKGLSSPEEQR